VGCRREKGDNVCVCVCGWVGGWVGGCARMYTRQKAKEVALCGSSTRTTPGMQFKLPMLARCCTQGEETGGAGASKHEMQGNCSQATHNGLGLGFVCGLGIVCELCVVCKAHILAYRLPY